MLLQVLLCGLVAFLLYRQLRRDIRLNKVTNWLVTNYGQTSDSKESDDSTSDRLPYIAILVPAYKEQSVIEAMIDKLDQIDYPRYRAYILVQAKEEKEKQELKQPKKFLKLAKGLIKGRSTSQLFNKYEKLFPRSKLDQLKQDYDRKKGKKGFQNPKTVQQWLLQEYEQTPTTEQVARAKLNQLEADREQKPPIQVMRLTHGKKKSESLNRAVEKLMGDLDENNTYIGLYDADSSFEPEVLTKVADSEGSKALQGQSLYLKNFRELEGLSKPFLFCFGLLQTRWCLGFETSRNLTNSSLGRVKRLMYAVGHGFFIRLDTLKEMGLFPSPVDDIPLGYQLSLSRIPIQPMPSLEWVEVTHSISSLIKQMGNWFQGELKLRQAKQQYQEREGSLSFRQHLKYYSRVFDNFLWLTRPFIVLLVALIAWVNGLTLPLLLAAAYYAYFSLAYLLSLSKTKDIVSVTGDKFGINKLRKNHLLLSALLAFSFPFIKAIGAAYRLCFLAKGKLIGQYPLIEKTER